MLQKYINKLFAKPQLQKSFSPIYFNEDIFNQNVISPNEYSNNVVVHRCVNVISQAASHVPWIILEKKNSKTFRIADHPIYTLLKRPNNIQGGSEFFSELIATKLLYGNAYIYAHGEQLPNCLFLLHPKNVKIISENNQILHYVYKNGSKEIKIPFHSKVRPSKILHIKNYNPTTSTTGLSTLKAAAKSIELHNNTTNWNNNLLKNGARPTGALMMKDSNGYLSDEQFTRLQEQLAEKFSGTNNAGNPLLLEGGLEWKEMSINPKDMDFIQSKNSAAREIALAFGLPPQLLGISGDSTYSNMQEARLALWEETIIPLLDKLSDSMSNWFSIILDKEIVIDFDRDEISALSERRQETWEKISRADFMTINEKRALVGLCPIENGDRIL